MVSTDALALLVVGHTARLRDLYVRQWQVLLHANRGQGQYLWASSHYYRLSAALGAAGAEIFHGRRLLTANTALVLELMRERGKNPIQAIYLLAVPTNVLVFGAA